jgi:hypothetical protein
MPFISDRIPILGTLWALIWMPARPIRSAFQYKKRLRLLWLSRFRDLELMCPDTGGSGSYPAPCSFLFRCFFVQTRDLWFLCCYEEDNKKLWQEPIAYFPLIWHGPHRKRRVLQFFCCCVCIRYRGNGFTLLLPSNIHIQTHRLMGWIYKVRHWYGLRCNDIYTRFHKVWFIQKLIEWGFTDRQYGDFVNLRLFFSE